MNSAVSISANFEDISELSIEEIDAVTGGDGDLESVAEIIWSGIKALYHKAFG